MPVFEELFRKSSGQPLVYNGQMIHLFDRLRVNDGQAMKVRFESANGEWRQGIHLSTDGSFEVNNQKSMEVVLWQDTAPRDVLLTIHSKKRECLVMNVWDTGNGLMHRGHNGAAMIIEETTTGKRYRCNDGLADDDFDDLVFRIDLVPIQPAEDSLADPSNRTGNRLFHHLRAKKRGQARLV